MLNNEQSAKQEHKITDSVYDGMQPSDLRRIAEEVKLTTSARYSYLHRYQDICKILGMGVAVPDQELDGIFVWDNRVDFTFKHLAPLSIAATESQIGAIRRLPKSKGDLGS